MKEIALDTETTGLDPTYDKIIEIGCVLLEDKIPTEKIFHTYINPGMPVSAGALKVHGLNNIFLAEHKFFYQIADDLLTFLEQYPLVMHNAPFDMSFLDGAFEETHGMILSRRHKVVDTLPLSREKFPYMRSYTLDALCKRFKVNLEGRKKHGALIDAQLLAQVYSFMYGANVREVSKKPGLTWEGQRFECSPEMRVRHDALVEKLGENAMWKKLSPGGS